jgi:hypothetical protein
VVGFVLVFLGGCNPIFINQPLSDPMTEEPDESLYGHWVGKRSADEEIHLFIGESDHRAGI